MSEAPSEADSETDVYKQVRIGPKKLDIPENWGVVQLGEVAEMHKGRSPTPKSDNSLFGGDINWVKIKEISENNKLITETEETVTEKGAKKSRLFPEGTLVIGIYGASRGGVSLLGMQACSHEGVVGVFDLNDDVDLNYLYYYLLYQNLNDMGHGAA